MVLRGIVLHWFKNYLDNRTQFVVVNGVPSNTLLIRNGVPQGSILGPLLFLVYIKDINNAVPGEKLKLFADDTNLFVQGPDICHASDHTNLLLSKLHSWFVANKLTLSLPKTCYTVFGKSRNDTCVLKLTDYKLQQVDHCKYLGLYLDKNLDWTVHIDYIYIKRS